MKMQEVKKALPEIISSHCGVMSHSTKNKEDLFLMHMNWLIKTLVIHGFWTKALKLHGFLKKRSL